MNMNAPCRTEACIAMLALLVAAHGVVNAQNVPRWSWQEPHAKVLPTGDLEWAPKAFEFKAGESIRYIDFESGNDANDGLSKQTPWKHHPWDPNAGGKATACKGVQTYVFKQGVDYRGEMNAHESGTADAPIILTRDPSWGEGPAVICGSEAVTGWKQGADNDLIPEPEKVWYVDLDWAPRNVWMVGEDGAVTRIALARTPNWTITDPDDIKSQWWTWKNPDKPFDNYATINGQRRHLAFDKEDINESKPQDYYEGAIVWTTKGWVMGSPFPARVLAVDRENGSLTFAGQWGGGPSYKIIRGCRYYLEDKPQYLDSPGEFWFDKKGDGGRLYLRLPGDQDPNQRPRRGGQTHPHDRQPGHEPRAHQRAHLPLHQRLLEPDRRTLLGLPREHRRGTRLRASAGQRHGHRGDQLHLRARPQGRAPEGRGHAGRHRQGGGGRQRVRA